MQKLRRYQSGSSDMTTEKEGGWLAGRTRLLYLMSELGISQVSYGESTVAASEEDLKFGCSQ